MVASTESVRTEVRKKVERVACKAIRSADQALSAGAWTKVAFNLVSYDLGGNFNLALNKFVAPVSGLYEIYCTLHWLNATITSAKYYGVSIYKNNSLVAEGLNHAAQTTSLYSTVKDEIFLRKDDVIEFYGLGEAAVTISYALGLSYGIIRLITKEGTKQ